MARKITLLFLIPFVALLILLGVRSTRREVAIYETQVSSDLVLTGRALRPTFAEIWRAEGETRALDLLARADHDLPEMTVVWVPAEKIPEGTSQTGNAIVKRETNGDNIGRVSVFLPIAEDRMPAGAIELSRSLDQEAQLKHDAIRGEALTTALALLAAIGLGSIVGLRFLGRPIGALGARAKRIGDGDLSPSSTLAESDELGALEREMNAMCERLSDARQRVIDEAEARFKVTEQLRHADRLSTVGRLAAGLAHELGTPLNVVSGRAKMIASGKLEAEAVTENATIIGGQTTRMTKIIRGLLDFARQGAAKKSESDASKIVSDTVRLLEPMSKKRGISLIIEGAEHSCTLLADTGQLEQVLTNLVVNAVDATADGGKVVVKLDTVRAAPPPGHEEHDDEGRAVASCVCLAVSDQGTGIRAEDLAHVFEPFFTTKDVGEGTGLGLSVAHGIVRDHGGWIEVTSTPGEGTTFSVYLPRSGK
ncbi:MAG: HAMP domain-containing sensor histidine kinase [Polyangiaceae bacterium]